MKNEKIDGIGTVWGGEYDAIEIDGIGKLRGDASAQTVNIDGIFKGKGQLNAEAITIDGLARQFRDMRSQTMKIEGFLKLRGASLFSEKLFCEGGLVCNREINADTVEVSGPISIRTLYGDTVRIKHHEDNQGIRKVPKLFSFFGRLYYGRRFSEKTAYIDTLECTDLQAQCIRSKVVRAQSVKLSDGCRIKTLHCDGPIDFDDTCTIGTIIQNGKTITPDAVSSSEEGIIMNMKPMEDILERFEQKKITRKEAGQLLRSMQKPQPSMDKTDSSLPWPDDDRLRIVVYRGTTLLKNGEADALETTLDLKGDVLDVQCAGNLNCQSIDGNVKAGGNVSSQCIDGRVTCGGNVRCRKIDGDVKAGGGVTLEA